MTDRMIVCPECDGTRQAWFDNSDPCALCRGSGTIPDRRAPTASDIEIERVMGLVDELANHPVMKALFALEAARDAK